MQRTNLRKLTEEKESLEMQLLGAYSKNSTIKDLVTHDKATITEIQCLIEALRISMSTTHRILVGENLNLDKSEKIIEFLLIRMIKLNPHFTVMREFLEEVKEVLKGKDDKQLIEFLSNKDTDANTILDKKSTSNAFSKGNAK
ncbi:MAG: hypothetical protein V3V16_14305 [Melioribacteraceae bacterium]